MPIVDDRGRLFGRLNLLDAVLGVLILGLIPLAYGAYVLFRTPAPRLVAIEPTTLVKGASLRVNVRGENLRPYMRVSFGNTQGNSFIFRNVGEATVDLNDMAPGVYDVILYDSAQERSRLPNAFTLLPTPLPASQVMLVGMLGNLTAEGAAAITAGTSIANVGEVVAVGKPVPETTRVYAGVVLEIPIEKAVRLPVMVRAGCSVRAAQGIPQCHIGDAALQPTSLILVNVPVGTLPFQIDQIRGLQPIEQVQLTVQFTARSSVIGLIQQGDVDRGPYLNELAAGAVVTGKGPLRPAGSDVFVVDVNFRADAQRGSSSWIYAASPLRVGSPIMFRTPQYELQGTVVAIDPPWPGASATQ
jgi:hypothetical protein